MQGAKAKKEQNLFYYLIVLNVVLALASTDQ